MQCAPKCYCGFSHDRIPHHYEVVYVPAVRPLHRATETSSNTLKRNPDIPGDRLAMGKNTQMVPGDLLDIRKTTQRGTPDRRATKSEANCLPNDGAISRGRVTSRTVQLLNLVELLFRHVDHMRPNSFPY